MFVVRERREMARTKKKAALSAAFVQGVNLFD
jgi:hypothetical protein